MPQASRKDVPTQRAQDKESKRARGALSCAECRRLKLKCDKTVPCSSCKRRGCSAICPNGSLITGQGTRFVLADTEKLHQKIANMSDRIRQLEDALAILQSSGSGPSGEPHPLLHRDLLKIKSSIELHSATLGGPGEDGGDGEEGNEEDGEQYIDAFGTLAIRDDGAATFYGRSAGSESLLIGEAASAPASAYSPYDSPPTNEPSPPQQQHSSYPHLQSNASTYNGHPGSYQDGTDTPLPSTITTLAASFPLSPSMPILPDSNSSPFAHQPPPVQGSPITLQTLTSYFLPPYAEALRLTQLYLEQAPWFFGAVTSRQIEQELLPLWYEEAATVASTPPSRNGAVSIASGSPSLAGGALGDNPNRAGTSHDLALLFVLFCFGSLTDTNLLSPPDNAHAERFYQLTKASLTLDPAGGTGGDGKQSRNGILERPPSVATVQALSLMAIYEGMCSGENSIESTWALMGLACKLAQSIGLHRDCARWKLTPAEVQKRRALFWELFITDCWQSLATGRIATFSLPFVDCELPFDPDQTMADDGSVQPSFPFWKARFGAECVSAVVQGTLTSRAPKYSIILDLDRKVRDMELPLYAQGPPPQGLGLAQTMSHFMPTNYRELTLLYIHRCFFAHAISSNPLDPIKSQYAPSFLAGYRSACTIVASVRQQFALFPAQIARFWVLWTHAFSASVMLASVATHSSRSKVAPAALLELKNACDLFESASGYGGRAIKFLPILRRLQMKAQQAYRDANSGLPASIPNDIFKPSQAEDQKDELSIFSGKTHTVSTKSAVSSTNPSSNVTPPSTSRGSGKNIRSSSDSPQQMFTDNPSFAGVHPSLVSELNVFHGHIKAQIQNAYRAGGEVFGGGPMMVDAIHRMPPGQQQQVQHQQQVPVHQLQQQMQMAQQQQHQQALYQQAQYQRQLEQQEAERLETERGMSERQERERQELERMESEGQEQARQQQLKQQMEIQRQQRAQEQEIQRQQELQRQQQQELIKQQQQQQQLEHRRQQEKHQQLQRQEEYRQQLENQQRQLQQQHTMSQYRQHSYNHEQQHPPPIVTALNYEVPASSHPSQVAPITAPAHPQRHLSHSHSLSNMQHTYQQQYQHIPHDSVPPQPIASSSSSSYTNLPPQAPSQHYRHNSQHTITPQQTGQAPHQVQIQHTIQGSHQQQQQQIPQQHSMYAVPPETSHYPTPESMRASSSMHSSSASSVNHTPPASAYGQTSIPPTPVSASYVPDTYKYWPAASSSFAMPDQQPHTYATAPPQMQRHQLYTPENALRGIAAEDHSLQETWQSYMNKVGSPRQFLED